MPLLALLAPLLGPLATALFSNLEKAWSDYVNKQITEAELHEKIQEALVNGLTQLEKSYADSLTSTFNSFMSAAAQSRIMQYVWATVACSQLLVLLWCQLGIPTITYFWGVHWPSAGTTVDWAYALVMFCLGGGAIAMRMGPGSTSLSDQLKSLIKK